MNNTKIHEKHNGHTSNKNPVGSKPPSRLYFLVPIHNVLSLHFMFYFEQTQILENTRKYREHIPKTHVRLKTTPPALVLVPIHDLLPLHVIHVQAKANIGKYRKYRKQIRKHTRHKTLEARNHPPGI